MLNGHCLCGLELLVTSKVTSLVKKLNFFELMVAFDEFAHNDGLDFDFSFRFDHLFPKTSLIN